MWPFNRKPKAPPAPEPELTPFDTQVLTLMGLAPDKCKVCRDKLAIDGIGVFSMLKGRDGAPVGRMQYEALDSLSSRTRRLSPRGQREVYVEHQKLLDSAQPEVESVIAQVDPAGAMPSAITTLETRMTASEAAMRQQEYMLRQQQVSQAISQLPASGQARVESLYRGMQQAGVPPALMANILQNNLQAFGGGVAPAPPDQL